MGFQVKTTPFGIYVVLEVAVGPCKGRFVKNMDVGTKSVNLTPDIEEAGKFDNASQVVSALINFTQEVPNLLTLHGK